MTTKTKFLSAVSAFVVLGVGVVAGLSVTSNASGGFIRGNEEAKTAIENNDYEGFKTALSEKASQRIGDLSEEDFAKIQEKYEFKKAMKGYKSAIEEAIRNNDREAFETAIKDAKEFKESNRSDDDLERERKELTDETIDEMFEKAVSQYEETGEVKLGGKKGGRGGDRRGRSGEEK